MADAAMMPLDSSSPCWEMKLLFQVDTSLESAAGRDPASSAAETQACLFISSLISVGPLNGARAVRANSENGLKAWNVTSVSVRAAAHVPTDHLTHSAVTSQGENVLDLLHVTAHLELHRWKPQGVKWGVEVYDEKEGGCF